uniref:Uncharacterized protein n=1 Tax=Neolamprologus brichardi TaxID=32507 RepID=A0A3Q4MMT6_NEOBR
ICFSLTMPTPDQIQTLPWLAFSLKMSPTEHAWDMLGRCIHQRQPQLITVAQLQAALIQE